MPKTFIKYFFVWSLSVLILAGGLVLIQKSGMFPQLFPGMAKANPDCTVTDKLVVGSSATPQDLVVYGGLYGRPSCFNVYYECNGECSDETTDIGDICMNQGVNTAFSQPYALGIWCRDWQPPPGGNFNDDCATGDGECMDFELNISGWPISDLCNDTGSWDVVIECCYRNVP